MIRRRHLSRKVVQHTALSAALCTPLNFHDSFSNYVMIHMTDPLINRSDTLPWAYVTQIGSRISRKR